MKYNTLPRSSPTCIQPIDLSSKFFKPFNAERETFKQRVLSTDKKKKKQKQLYHSLASYIKTN